MNEITPLTTSYFTSSFSGCELPKLQELTQKQGSTLDNDDWLCLAQMRPVFSQPFFIRKRKLCCKDALCSRDNKTYENSVELVSFSVDYKQLFQEAKSKNKMWTNAGKQKVLFQKICIHLPIRVFGLDFGPSPSHTCNPSGPSCSKDG